MKITFIRHGSLLEPFEDYNKLTVFELSQLALQKIDPTIDVSMIDRSQGKIQQLESKYDQVLVSPSSRTLDTALALGKYLDLPKASVTAELREVLFDPQTFVSDQEYRDYGLQTIREKLFAALANNSNLETGDQVVARVKKLKNHLSSLDAESVLIITHGFLLRFLDIFFRSGSIDFSQSALSQATNYDYLSGFTVIID